MRHLVVNYVWVHDGTVTVGATDDERWGWELETGDSGANAFTFVQASVVDRGPGIAPTETVGFHLHPSHQLHRGLAERAVGALCAMAWDIHDRRLDPAAARALYFGRVLRP